MADQRSSWWQFGVAAAVVWIALQGSPSGLQAIAADDAAPAEAKQPALNFEDDILPILEVRCLKCHGAQMRKAGLDLRRQFTIVKGGDSGAAIVPGKPDESLLIEMIEKKEMPPKEDDPLDARQLELLRRWVASGAAIKRKSEEPLEAADADHAISDADRKFWSFQPPVRPAVPVVRAADRVHTPVDAFLLERLEAHNLSFNPDAAKTVLLRRLCFDLWGLPPTREQIAAFLADDASDAVVRLVDGLLDSPRYGERWGRHWLDVVGYAESDGYLDADRERTEAWRYRDYVIRAFNSDKPYDQFIREQIAGDELSDWRNSPELTAEMVDQLVATGFLRTASDPTYPGYKEKPEIFKVLADTIQIVGSTFLGVTVQCARCHEHKLEPISQRDYYQLQAVLTGAYDPERWLASSERAVPLATDAQLAVINAHNKGVTERLAALNAELNRLTTEHRDKLLNKELADVPAEAREKVKAALLVAADKRNDEQKKLVTEHAPKVAVDEKALVARFPDLKPDLDKLRAAIGAETALMRPVTQLRGLVDLGEKAPETHVLRRGDFNNPGKAVPPGVPAVLTAGDARLNPTQQAKSSGRRRALADWLTSPSHPTTARLHVNRIWAWHFGRGIVETLDDFGHTGKAPSHPELLDWLATEFVRQGYSQKALHRVIVLSTAYRQSSAFDAAKAAVDGDDVFLWAFRPRRHEGETLRDSVLAAAGKLNLQMFGPAVPVSRHADGSVVTADDAQGNRRSVYVQVRRSQPVTLMESFDTPKMEVNCTRRSEAIVATQALALLNSPFVETSSRAVGERIARSASDRAQRTAFAWELLFSRQPTDAEQKTVAAFVDAFVAAQLGEKAQAATAVERQAAEDAAWPHVALTLLNTNEFLFVD
ncbi:MAG: PSD1 domain-containing protein [Planctomycetia bacterium]|nr:PSD1 domain-containing protein [Planctomycetia bacterium]